MSAEEESVNDETKVSFQSLRKDELRLLASAFERNLLEDLERLVTLPDGVVKTMLAASFLKRSQFLARLEEMGLTTTFTGWEQVADGLEARGRN